MSPGDLKSVNKNTSGFTRFDIFTLDRPNFNAHCSRFYFSIDMANTKSALKYIRKTETRTLRNRQVKSRLKTLSKKVEAAVEVNDKDALVLAVRIYISALDKAGKIGLVHRNKIARHKARCAALIAA